MDNERIQYRRCNDQDIAALQRLWSLCFETDKAEDIQTFFDKIYPLSVSFGGFCGDAAVTMLHLLPAYAHTNDCDVPVWYLYAGATHPAHRSNGYYRQLMEFARKWAYTSEGYAIYLRPAEPSLFRYYENLGYAEAIFSHTRRASTLTETVREMPLNKYLQQRECALEDSVILWQPIAAVVENFIDSQWQAAVDGDGLLLARNGVIYEQIPLASDELSRENGALWAPTTDDGAILNRLHDNIGYSLFFGD